MDTTNLQPGMYTTWASSQDTTVVITNTSAQAGNATVKYGQVVKQLSIQPNMCAGVDAGSQSGSVLNSGTVTLGVAVSGTEAAAPK